MMPQPSLGHPPMVGGLHRSDLPVWALYLRALRLRTLAWIAAMAARAESRIYISQASVAAARACAEAAESERLSLAAHRQLWAAEEADDAEFRNRLRAFTAATRRQTLEQEVETERLLLQREQLRQRRLAEQAPSKAAPPASLPADEPPGSEDGRLELAITDRQIEALALRAVTRFSALAPLEAERSWARWRQELGLRLPPYAAQEVAARAAELRKAAR